MNRSRLRLEDRSTLLDRVVTRLREAILKREFQPGERLVQEELAEAMGVSRMPIREALRQLEAEGLVTMEPHKGAMVTPVTAEDIEEVYSLRAMLEGMAVSRSLPHLTEEDKRQLHRLVEEMEEATLHEDAELFIEKNGAFHELMRKGCRWRRTQMILDSLWNGIPPHTPGILPGQMQQSLAEHKQMLELIEAGEAEKLSQVIKQHILRTGEAFIEHYDRKESQ
ncbi:GntR family transcriptional regulator [Brevibacillus composti]|uniref:GntR family transcriptional regulator n=1 Tax=Brevibacillus composti TaxID=2796470 RepID=A0A7T5EJ81_9BACL|nr:GntR family transcriptional regulator [Brevibacillus composti]QQE73614.1 GntR family transcriptional regulator [Brevibacillus composti]QUO40696.1 GntR family transcriptional regulator [Brevibacillus composti]